MATEILEGTIPATEPVRSKRGYVMFEHLKFRDKAGAERMLPNVCAGGEVAIALRKGGEGRFYLTKGGGQSGIHGVRMKDGTQAYSHYNNMEIIFWIGIGAGAIGLLLWLAGVEGVPVTPLVIGPLLAVALYFYRKHKAGAKADYERDATPR